MRIQLITSSRSNMTINFSQSAIDTRFLTNTWIEIATTSLIKYKLLLWQEYGILKQNTLTQNNFSFINENLYESEQNLSMLPRVPTLSTPL